jgi:hypothetical protein
MEEAFDLIENIRKNKNERKFVLPVGNPILK